MQTIGQIDLLMDMNEKNCPEPAFQMLLSHILPSIKLMAYPVVNDTFLQSLHCQKISPVLAGGIFFFL